MGTSSTDERRRPGAPSVSLRWLPYRDIARGLFVVLAALVFALLSDAAQAGARAWVPYMLAALLVMVNGLGYAQLASGAPKTGGAYRLVFRQTEEEAPAFLTGWTLTLSGLALCGVLAQGAGRHLAGLLSRLLNVHAAAAPLSAGMVVLVVLFRVLSRQRRRRIGVAGVLVAVLVLVLILAIGRVDLHNVRRGRLDVGLALSPLIVAFVGLELVTSAQRERSGKESIVWSLLTTAAAATVLAAALLTVAVGVLGSSAVTASDVPVALVGETIAGTWGGVATLAVGALVSVLGLSHGLSIVLRQLFVMSRDGFWPPWLSRVNYRRRSPLHAVAISSLLVIPLAFVPLPIVSRVGGLLYLAVLMFVNLAVARSPAEVANGQPGFRLPLHPWIPALSVAVDLLAVSLWDLETVAYAIGCLAVGRLVYVLYGRGRYAEAQQGVTVFRPTEVRHTPSNYTVLVPVANPATAGPLLRLASQLASAQDGEVIALRVEVVPDPLPLDTGRRRGRAGLAILEQATRLANEERWPIRPMTRVARSVAEGIADTASEEQADLIITGWRGPVRSRETSLGDVLNGVLRNAPCDTLIVRGDTIASPERILVPSAGGPHARAAARLATALADALGGAVMLLSVRTEPPTDEEKDDGERSLARTLEGLSPSRPPELKVVVAESIVEGIVREAQEHDLILLGVSEESLFDRLVFGTVPLQVASRVPATALVQGSRGATDVWYRRVVRAVGRVLPALSRREQSALRRDLLEGAQPGIDYLGLIVLSGIIAALGLLLNSPAVVIGAMLIAPLMSPIMAFAMGIVLGDVRLIRVSVEAILKGIALALIIAAFVGLLSPLKAMTNEMVARSRPTLLDLAVALASGLAGAYALSRKGISAALPGVALAASLMPPLAAVGLALAMGNARVAGGALLLFVANIAAISLAAGVVFILLGIRPQVWARDSRRQLRRRMAAASLMLLVVAVPLGLLFAGIVRDARQERAAEAVVAEYVREAGADLVGLEANEQGQELVVVATIRSSQAIDEEWVEGLADALETVLDAPVRLDVVVLPVIRSEPG
jgi:uncharacterized hydrophobic protein (TIGR00271 family)